MEFNFDVSLLPNTANYSPPIISNSHKKNIRQKWHGQRARRHCSNQVKQTHFLYKILGLTNLCIAPDYLLARLGSAIHEDTIYDPEMIPFDWATEKDVWRRLILMWLRHIFYLVIHIFRLCQLCDE